MKQCFEKKTLFWKPSQPKWGGENFAGSSQSNLFIFTSNDTFLLNHNSHANPVDFGIANKPNPVIEYVTEVDVLTIIRNVSTDFNFVE